MKLTKSSAQLALALSLLSGTLAYAPNAAANAGEAEPVVVEEKKEQPAPVEEKKAVPVEEVEVKEEEQDAGPAVAIDGGDVTSDTTIDVSADGGTAISDASGGDGNFTFSDLGEVAPAAEEEEEGPRGVLGLFEELTGGDEVVVVGGDTAASGNGGTASAEANGGTIEVGDINSGGNSGATITVGDIGQAPEEAVVVEEPKKVVEAPKVVEQPKVVEAPKVVKAPKVVEVKAEAPKAVTVAAAADTDSGNTARVRNVRAAAADTSSDDTRSGRAARAARGGNAAEAEAVSGLPSTGTGAEVLGQSGINGGLAALAAVGAAVAGAFGFRRRSA